MNLHENIAFRSAPGRRGALAARARHTFQRLARAFIEYHELATFKVQAVAIIGVVSFPLFYINWKFVFPQPHESLLLRAIGFGLCVNLLLISRYPSHLKKYTPLVYYVSIFYCIPFFFTYMLFMNTAGIIWQLSVISGFVYLMMLCDLANAIIMAIAGSAVAYLAYYIASGGAPVPYDYLVLLPILAFVLFGVASLNYSNDLLVREKMQTANNIAAHVAHEMRTPLLGVKLDADRIAGVIPELLEGYNWAQSNGRKGRLARSQKDGIQPALQRITQHSESANVVIEMLLANAAFSRKQAPNKPCSIQEIISLTLQRFNFRGNQRQLVTHDHGPDFMFMGSDVLMMHVLFNLMKNGLRAIERCGYGEITIRTEIRGETGQLIFSDTGHGMSPDLARRLFMPFITNEEIGVGNGIGLVFCRGVIDSFGGTIECTSALGEGTTFTISVPIAH